MKTTEVPSRFCIERVYDGRVLEELASLADAVDTLVVPPCADDIEVVLGLLDRLGAKVACALGRFDEERGWEADGSLSLTAWMARHGRMLSRDAHRAAMTAKKLRQLPVTASAWEDGKLSSGQVGAVVANVRGSRVGLLAQQEDAVVEVLEPLLVPETVAVMRAWRLCAEALEDGPEPPERPSELHLSSTLEGRRELSGHLRPEHAAVVEEAIAAAGTKAGAGEEGKSPAERRAAALVEVCNSFLANLDRPEGTRRNRPQVNVVVDLEDLMTGGPGRLVDGTPVSPSAVSLLSCDCELHRILRHGRSAVLDYGTATRTISQALWSALVVRDGHCRHPGCDRPPRWCEAHHLVHFSKGGPTRMDNLVLLCSRHHHLYHEPGWKVVLQPDATFTVLTPAGEMLSSRPPP